jgi:hypothetical protein
MSSFVDEPDFLKESERDHERRAAVRTIMIDSSLTPQQKQTQINNILYPNAASMNSVSNLANEGKGAIICHELATQHCQKCQYFYNL